MLRPHHCVLSQFHALLLQIGIALQFCPCKAELTAHCRILAPKMVEVVEYKTWRRENISIVRRSVVIRSLLLS